MADHLRLAKTDSPPERGGFVMTDTARDILLTISIVRQLGAPNLGMIAGSPGVGKSEALKHFVAQETANCLYIQAVRGEGTPWNFAGSLRRQVGRYVRDYGDQEQARHNISQAIAPGTLLIVDEAQYLNRKPKNGEKGDTLEWLRGLAETGGFPVILCGDMKLLGAVEAIPQLDSRIRSRTIIPRATRADVAAVARAYGFDDPLAVQALEAVAGQAGGMRNVQNVMEFANRFAGNERAGLSHMKAAISHMKLAPKGSK